ncbi:deleted in azoospermia-like isoform X1 [Chelonia mydas]|uniref:deleted in azoospermia-like isoform X1 n=1 Tax=Chelonia mydas TaxID=8469 RepID=UPI001CA857D4|nr:deleted in azoospermia-like isoform X1 [Chelonia mydas]
MSAANPESQCASISREENTQLSSTTSQGYVLPEGKIMPNTVFVGGIDIRMDETEIRSFFARYGTVKEVKIITDRTGVSKGYGFVSFLDNVDVQKIVESQINFHGKKLKLGPAIRKQQNLCAYHVQPRHLGFNPPVPQFHSVWSNQNAETYMPPPAMMSPVTQYVQAYPYGSQAVLIQQQVPVGYQPAYNYQVPPQWPPGEQRNYVIPPGTPRWRRGLLCHGTGARLWERLDPCWAVLCPHRPVGLRSSPAHLEQASRMSGCPPCQRPCKWLGTLCPCQYQEHRRCWPCGPEARCHWDLRSRPQLGTDLG